MAKIQPTLPKGTRDFLPEEMFRRQHVINTVKNIFERFGYEPLETPSLEKLDVLSGKYGEEGEQLIFRVLKRGTGLEELLRGRKEFRVEEYDQLVDEALKYDLTVPLSRVVAMHQNELVFPFKRYQIQPVWRADRPQRGRYREFYQCDVDTVGTPSVLADAESIAVVYEVLSTLGFKKFKIRINNRKILNGILEYAGVDEAAASSVLIAIDKLEKIGWDRVEKELAERGIPEPQIAKILSVQEISDANDEVLSELERRFPDVESLAAGVAETAEILADLEALGVPPEYHAVDLFLVRGLGYYTGPIYESVVEEPKIGSLTGGGRYDNLIGMFLGRDIPATGTSFGIERIIDVMKQLDMFPESRTRTDVLVTLFDESTREASVRLARELRHAGLRVENFFETSKMKKQLSYADKKGIPFAAIIGPDELQAGEVTLKNLRNREQRTVVWSEVGEYLRRAGAYD